MQVDREQLMHDGFVIIRQVIAPDDLPAVRASYETLIERQGGREWLSKGAQPRLTIVPHIDAATANAVELWLGESTLGVARQLLCVGEAAAVTWMWCMCSPLEDHGPANWHRDVHPIDMAPMRLLELDMLENGPRYVQWNIALYDDDVFWAVPGSHRRLNTPKENQQLLADDHAPLTGGGPIKLKAGDGVVYVNFLLHWGSNYSRKLRRTLHGGHAISTADASLGCDKHLSSAAQQLFEQWRQQTSRTQDGTEAALRSVLDGDAPAYHAALEALHPGVGPAGKLVLTIYLCKAAQLMRINAHPDLAGVPDDLLRPAKGAHQITLNWGPDFGKRFCADEIEALWRRFEPLDQRLQADEEQFMPGYQSGPMRYYFEDFAEPFSVGDFVNSWS